MKLFGNKKKEKKLDFSKKIIMDVRVLLWIVTIAAVVLAFACVVEGYIGSLPWIATLVGLPWGAHGTICSFYLNMAKSDHKEGGITYEMAMNNLPTSQTATTNNSINTDYGI